MSCTKKKASAKKAKTITKKNQSENLKQISLFEEAFSTEILKSERIRVIILSVIGFVIAVWLLSVLLFIPEKFAAGSSDMINGLPLYAWLALLFFIFGLYEVFMIVILSRSIRNNSQAGILLSFTNSMIEISIPTLVIYITSCVIVPIQSIFSPAEFVYFILIALSSLRLNFTMCLFTGLVAGIEYFIMAVILIEKSKYMPIYSPLLNYGWHVVKALLLVISGLTTGFVAIQVKTRISGSIKRILEMTESFSRFVPKEFLGFLDHDNIVQVQLGDQVMKEMTILFSDIRSFTSISEKLTPQENIDFLNSYFTVMSPVIRDHGGFIDKYIGDAIMALFPNSVDDALNAATSMFTKLKDFNTSRIAAEKDPILIGIGIHTGVLMLGTVGEHNRLETTVISDAVNIASRLESLTKDFKCSIIISKYSSEKLINSSDFIIREIGNVPLKGRNELIAIMEVQTD